MRNERISLRALEPTDIELLMELENDERLWHLSNTLAPFSRFVLEQYLMAAQDDIYSTRQLRLVIDLNEPETTAAGLIDLYDFDPHNRRAGVGIVIREEMRKKNIAFDALQLLKDYAFNTLQLKQLYAGIPANNTSSLELFRKAGYLKTGMRKSWIRLEEDWIDEHFYQLVSERTYG